jgi:hypothetical protein
MDLKLGDRVTFDFAVEAEDAFPLNTTFWCEYIRVAYVHFRVVDPPFKQYEDVRMIGEVIGISFEHQTTFKNFWPVLFSSSYEAAIV